MSKFLLLLLILLHVTCTLAGKDFYKILGVSRNADETQIRRAFKKLSLKYHPDKNKDNPKKAKEKFVEVANAYDVLSDPEKRKTYDMYGEEGVNKEEAMKSQQESQKASFGNMFGQNANMDDIFEQFFGNSGGKGGNFHFNFGGGGGGFGGGKGFGGGHQQFTQKSLYETYFKDSEVQNLDLGSLSQFYRRSSVWVILFYSSKSKDIEQVSQELKTLASKMHSIIDVGVADCEENEEI
mmetsp:Transcript_11627/g.13202  ORF Transcript_11627/g.13202 Transcript_11627/m.13202 type:complete len:238 (-) Transcript_11627:801-1514(-)|eukprot:CAMPEP_0168325272 /NCGR_PEP_ID=MMETSP0213-20121227/4597_1 /TAXON_ID=151035 /ORGANISM="Euplotes harpa, Strain FSP1.4" /LENGTH=237 /DNA_ID=CAMNT_0008327741 /DNA_START=13 /DNA_END=726 /DNA_ORIENTATION=+